MAILLLCLAVVIVAITCPASRAPIRHRWRRRQARVMSQALCGRDRTQPPALLYARLRAVDGFAFEELLLDSFERQGHRVICNRRYTGDGVVYGQVMIDGRTWLIQAKRHASAVRPKHVRAFASVCTARGLPGLFIHTGRNGGTRRDVIDRHAVIEIVSGKRLVALITGGALSIAGSVL